MKAVSVSITQHKQARLKTIARSKKAKTNNSLEEQSTATIAQQAIIKPFTLCASHADVALGLTALDELDTAFKRQ
jgi:hypothetical protein